MNKDEKSLLLYFETCVVDYGGRVDGRRMNVDDFKIAEKWSKEGFIDFGRIKSDMINNQGANAVKLSEEAWILAHKERRERAKRMWEKRNWITTKENIEINGINSVRLRGLI